MKTITLADVARITQGSLIGDGMRQVTGICSPDRPEPDKLCVIWEKNVLDKIPQDVPVLTTPGSLMNRDGVEMVQPRAALIPLLAHFDMRKTDPPGVHASAVLHPGCDVAADASIGPGCIVSEGARIGSGCILQANVFIGKHAVLGENVRLDASVVVQDFVEIGARSVIHAGTVLGTDGFGFVRNETGGWRKIPQIGTVIIGEDVEIGANCTIDRATFGVTHVRRGVKMGSLVHIAHNCDVGEDCLIVGFVGIGGSTEVGAGSLLAGMSGVADHVKIGKGVTVAGRSGVTKDIPDGLTISGFPAREHKEEGRFQASLRRVATYSERLKKLERLVVDMEERMKQEETVFEEEQKNHRR